MTLGTVLQAVISISFLFLVFSTLASGLVEWSVWEYPEMGFQTSCPTQVFWPSLPVMSE